MGHIEFWAALQFDVVCTYLGPHVGYWWVRELTSGL